jgi:hypothetical protein
VDDTLNPDTPDSIFQNWVSLKMEMWHYTMFAENRRERREEILDMLEDKGFKMENIVDYTSAEEDGFLGRNQAYSLIEQMRRALSRADEKEIIY